LLADLKQGDALFFDVSGLQPESQKRQETPTERLRQTKGNTPDMPAIMALCPIFFGVGSTNDRFAQLFNIHTLYFAFHSSFQRPTP
jgi:hypothetical protein